MIRAYHTIITAYGFWLPNDPRGSWSTFVGSWDLSCFGAATKVDTRSSLADRPHDRNLRAQAKNALKYPPVHFDGHQALAIGKGFATAIAERNYRLYACSILPEHVHMVIARCDRAIERITAHLKAKATQQLNSEGRHPLAAYADSRGGHPTPWGEYAWYCYLDSIEDIDRAIRYVEENPTKEGKRSQRWSFVVRWPDPAIV
jgi:REP element-mobilizing transposase RayT